MRARRRHVGYGIAVEFILQVGDQRLDIGRVGPPCARGGHLACPKFSYDPLPGFRIFADMGDIQAIQGKSFGRVDACRLGPLAVATATVTGTISPVRLDGFGGGFGSPGACPEAFGNCAPDTTVRESRNARAAGRSQRQPHRVWLSTRSAASTYPQTYC